MPRKHRSARDRAAPPPPPDPDAARSGIAPYWAQVPGSEVRWNISSKQYRCPGCDHMIRPGLQHLVVVPDDDPETRRHWHTNCWQTELRGGPG
jgi:hypothetical protein